MKTLYCAYKGCSDRRPHYDSNEDTRPAQKVVVEDSIEKAYCSITCAIMDGAYTLKDKETK